MIWQDAVIAAVVLVFTLTAIPMIVHKVKLPRLTTIPMVVGAAALIACYATLGLWASVAVETGALLLWGVLLRRSLA